MFGNASTQPSYILLRHTDHLHLLFHYDNKSPPVYPPDRSKLGHLPQIYLSFLLKTKSVWPLCPYLRSSLPSIRKPVKGPM